MQNVIAQAKIYQCDFIQVAQAEHKFEEKCAEVTKLTEMLSAATAQTQELSNCLAAAEEEKLMKQV